MAQAMLDRNPALTARTLADLPDLSSDFDMGHARLVKLYDFAAFKHGIKLRWLTQVVDSKWALDLPHFSAPHKSCPQTQFKLVVSPVRMVNGKPKLIRLNEINKDCDCDHYYCHASDVTVLPGSKVLVAEDRSLGLTGLCTDKLGLEPAAASNMNFRRIWPAPKDQKPLPLVNFRLVTADCEHYEEMQMCSCVAAMFTIEVGVAPETQKKRDEVAKKKRKAADQQDDGSDEQIRNQASLILEQNTKISKLEQEVKELKAQNDGYFSIFFDLSKHIKLVEVPKEDKHMVDIVEELMRGQVIPATQPETASAPVVAPAPQLVLH